MESFRLSSFVEKPYSEHMKSSDSIEMSDPSLLFRSQLIKKNVEIGTPKVRSDLLFASLK